MKNDIDNLMKDAPKVFVFTEQKLKNALKKTDLNQADQDKIFAFLSSDHCHDDLFRFSGEYKSVGQ